uniref:Uncharacterized protein n=1 Tax=Arundo donax TaxID=35708 RepID=A0A0A9BA63_ARUDO
MSSASKTAARR